MADYKIKTLSTNDTSLSNIFSDVSIVYNSNPKINYKV